MSTRPGKTLKCIWCKRVWDSEKEIYNGTRVSAENGKYGLICLGCARAYDKGFNDGNDSTRKSIYAKIHSALGLDK